MLTNLQEKYDYSDVLIVPNDSDVVSRSKVKLEREFHFPWSKQVHTGIGIIAANMDTVGTPTMARELCKLGMFTALHKHVKPTDVVNFFQRWTRPATISDSTDLHDHIVNFGNPSYGKDFRNLIFYTIGSSQKEIDTLEALQEKNCLPDMVCIDIANGYANIILKAIEQVRKKYPDMVIMAGNVVTGDRAYKLYEAGADIIKVGIGPGSACTTRKQTGVGYPQLSAVYEVSKALEASGALVCADGGCTVPGDVGKAMIAGADFVMLGGMLAGHKESELPLIEYEKKLSKRVKVNFSHADGLPRFSFSGSSYGWLGGLPDAAWKNVPLETPRMSFYGMSSKEAMDKHNGGVAEYRSAEGRSVTIPYRGEVKHTIKDILGGLRSTMTYVGVEDIKDIAYSATFVKTRHQLNTVFVK